MANGVQPDFTGKIVILYLTNPARPIEDGTVLEDATFKNYGNKLFVVGRVPSIDETDNWVANLKCGVAWDSVNHYLIFDSREDYIARMRQGRRPFSSMSI